MRAEYDDRRSKINLSSGAPLPEPDFLSRPPAAVRLTALALAGNESAVAIVDALAPAHADRLAAVVAADVQRKRKAASAVQLEQECHFVMNK